MAGPLVRCQHFRLKHLNLPSLGGPTKVALEICDALGALAGSGKAEHQKLRLTMIKEMGKALGGSVVQSECAFGGAPSCPYYIQ